MNFAFTDDQETIKRTAREFLAARYGSEEIRRLADDERGFTDEQWAEICGLDWPGIFVPEEHGGQGLGVIELAILQEELGYALAPTPFLSNAIAAIALQYHGSDEQRERTLRALATGEQRASVALSDDPAAPVSAEGATLSGAKLAVPDAATADLLLVVTFPEARTFIVDPSDPGVTVEPVAGMDPTRKLANVRLDGVAGDELPENREEAQVGGRAGAAIQVAVAAESVGIAQRAMEMAVEYAKERKQFGTPIGAFQAVSHRCAGMLLEVEGARSAVYHAAWACDHDPEAAPLAAAMAMAYAGDAGTRVPASSIQVHGGIGFTWEHDLHFFLKRAQANAHMMGSSQDFRARVASLLAI
jgi:alkylation response protein AidB-like acyl-CoA dehydrogenase